MTLARRELLRLAPAVAVAGALTPAVSGCQAAAAAGLVFDSGWLSTVSASVAASAITAAGSKWMKAAGETFEGAWKSWTGGALEVADDQAKQGWGYFANIAYGNGIPPAVMIAASRGNGFDPKTDRLIVVVGGGAKAVVFDAWAWQGLGLFIHDMTNGRSGNDLAAYQTLCSVALLPSDVNPTDQSSPSGRSQILSYQSRNGAVELTRTTNEDGSTQVQVMSLGFPTAKGQPTTRSYKLDSQNDPAITSTVPG